MSPYHCCPELLLATNFIIQFIQMQEWENNKMEEGIHRLALIFFEALAAV